MKTSSGKYQADLSQEVRRLIQPLMFSAIFMEHSWNERVGFEVGGSNALSSMPHDNSSTGTGNRFRETLKRQSLPFLANIYGVVSP